VQTNPRPEPEPDVAPFLHGAPDTPPDVQVVWRADLDPEDPESWEEIVWMMPPLTREALPVPIYELRAWLRKQADAQVADVERGLAAAGELRAEPGDARRVLRWRGKEDSAVVDPDRIRPGDTVVVPATYGGADRFGWNPRSPDPVQDVAEPCLAELVASYPSDALRRPKLRLRLHPSLLPRPNGETHRRLCSLLHSVVRATSSETGDPWPPLRRLLNAWLPLADDARLKAAIQAVLEALAQGQRCRMHRYPKNDGVVVIASVPISLTQRLPEAELEQDESEDDEASFTGREVTLEQHLEGVGKAARHFATAAGLHDERLVKTVELAGRWHDQGKRDWRFQAWLRGSELQALAGAEPLAKSGRDPSRWKPSAAFGYPSGARHEFVSVRLFERVEGDVAQRAIPELARLLIGTHHGFGRPFAPVVLDRSAIDVKLSLDGREVGVSSDHGLYHLDSGWTDLFWSLVRHFGWWGLAYLEALLITADRYVSAREQQQGWSGEVKL